MIRGAVPTDPLLTSAVLSGPSEATARVTGAFPDWLRGHVVRTAPALFSHRGFTVEHWFDALGMLYRFTVDGPSSVSFRQRLLDSEVLRTVERSGRAPFAMFSTKNGRSFLRRMFQPFPVSTDNTNVNVLPIGEEWIAMTETERQLAIDPETLETRHEVRYHDDLNARTMMLAHPHFDFQRDRVVNIAFEIGPQSTVSLYEHAPRARTRKVVARWRTARLPYMHSFGLTPRSAILIAHPMDVHALSLLWSNHFAAKFRWRPEAGAQLIVLDRDGSAPARYETEALFVFHVINAFDDGDDLVLDVLAYEDARLMIDLFRTEQLLSGLPDLRAIATRLRISRSKKRVTRELLSPEGFEFPAIHYRARSGQAYRHVFGAALHSATSATPSAIVRLDVTTGEMLRFSSSEVIYGEPMFVPHPESTRDEDGIVLAVGTSRARNEASLLALDANRLTPIADARIDVHLPLGFHGSWAGVRD